MRTMGGILAALDRELLAGGTYTVPGETTLARETTASYCLQPDSHCHTCSLVSYGRDCHNNEVEDSLGCRRCETIRRKK